MLGRIKLTCLAFLLVVFLPYVAAAQDISFSVIPAEMRINDLSPGQSVQFELAIHNKDAITRGFTVSTFSPPEEERRPGRAAFPDNTWISFSPSEVEIAAYSTANVMVMVALPPEQEWANRNWEIWLAVTANSSDILGARLFVRLLVSPASVVRARFNAGLFVGVAVAIVLLGYVGYHRFRRNIKPH